jgi:hypothetical protein
VFVERGDQRRQIVLANEVQLETLPGRDAQRRVADLTGQAVDRPVLPGRERTPRDADAHHADVIRTETAPAPLGPDRPVVLLVDAVELEQLIALRRERGGGAVQLLRQRTPELTAGHLDLLDWGRRRHRAS